MNSVPRNPGAGNTVGPLSICQPMTPDKRNAIIAQIAKLMDSGKYPAEIVEILQGSGLSLEQAKELVFAASSQVAPAYHSRQQLEEAFDPASRTLLICVAIIGFVTILTISLIRSSSPDSPLPDSSLTPIATEQPQPATKTLVIPAAAQPQKSTPVWPSDNTTQIPQPGRNTYDYQAGFFQYGIVRYECPPGAPTGTSDVELVGAAQVVAKAEFLKRLGPYSNGFRVLIATADGGQRLENLQYICVLLNNTERDGVYAGIIIPVGYFFYGGPQIIPQIIDAKKILYKDLFIAANADGPRRYPIIEKYDAEYVRQEEAIRHRLSVEEARAIALPRIHDWLTENGYDEQSETFLRRSEENNGIAYQFKVAGDTKTLNDEVTRTLFTLEVNSRTGAATLLLSADCAEFLRLLRERGLVPTP